MQSKDLKQLLEDYRNGNMNEADRAAFEQLLHSQELEAQLQQLLDESLQQTEPVTAHATQEFVYEQIKERYLRRESTGTVGIPFLKRPWLRYAALVLITLGIVTYLFTRKEKPKPQVAETIPAHQSDIAPGRDGAILTLADGRQVVLDSLANGVIANQNGAQVVLQNGSLKYHAQQQAGNIAYNTMRTPRGRQFQLILPDGTKVWLNAASAITYPTAFNGVTRNVTIEGEAYFEVAKDASKPFIVKIDETNKVQVLGTHFNINAYTDEASIRTTLLEGRVKVFNKDSVILKAAQQAVATTNAPLKVYSNVDIDRVMAWRRGLFNFDGADIKAVMREIGRWYDLDIVYEAEPEQEEMAGEIQRSLTLSQVMNVLQKIDVHYRIQGRTLIVMAKNQN
jgi:transmembrane sensor